MIVKGLFLFFVFLLEANHIPFPHWNFKSDTHSLIPCPIHFNFWSAGWSNKPILAPRLLTLNMCECEWEIMWHMQPSGYERCHHLLLITLAARRCTISRKWYTIFGSSSVVGLKSGVFIKEADLAAKAKLQIKRAKSSCSQTPRWPSSCFMVPEGGSVGFVVVASGWQGAKSRIPIAGRSVLPHPRGFHTGPDVELLLLLLLLPPPPLLLLLLLASLNSDLIEGKCSQ